MELSARNVVKGKIIELDEGAVNVEVALEVAAGVVLTSIITKKSAERLGLKVGGTAYAVVKASNVMLGID